MHYISIGTLSTLSSTNATLFCERERERLLHIHQWLPLKFTLCKPFFSSSYFFLSNFNCFALLCFLHNSWFKSNLNFQLFYYNFIHLSASEFICFESQFINLVYRWMLCELSLWGDFHHFHKVNCAWSYQLINNSIYLSI